MSDNSEMESAIHEYVAECEDLLNRVSNHLDLIQKGTLTPEMIDSIYRDIHTIKGSSQLFGFNFIGEVSHAVETSLDPIRKKKLQPSAKLIDAVFRCVDAIDQMVSSIKAKEERNFADLLSITIPNLLEASLEGAGGALDVQTEPKISTENFAAIDAALVDPLKMGEPRVSEPSIESIMAAESMKAAESLHPDENPKPVEPVVAKPTEPVKVAEPPKAPEPVKAAEPVKAPEPIKPPEAPKPVEVAKKPEPPKPAPAVPTHDKAPSAPGHGDGSDSSSIRVPVGLLDNLMTLMGEMVLVRNQVQQYAGKSDDLGFLNLSQRLDIVTSEIQGEVMKTRMQPIGNVLSKFQRVVRDLARDLNKKIELILEGAETELDKTLLEAVKDPIMHIVRNSCDHGIENLEDRRTSGKPEGGKILIRSFHEGGQVIVEVSDDGRGLSKEKLISKAIEKGLISAEKGVKLSERDAHNLIFAPGFSTATQVTNVSGRGVGMDVVKNNIEGIGGMVELESVFGKGTTIRLKIPLTLAIVPTMIVRVGSEQFAIPQVKLVELVRVEKGSSSGQIEFLQDKLVYRLRGRLLPLVSLKEVLGIQKSGESQVFSEVTNIVVLNAERQMFGLIVDEVLDTAEVVVKPLSSFVNSLSIYSGATVLGDGSIALILDVVGMAQSQHLLSEGAHNQMMEQKEISVHSSSDTQEFLLFNLNSPTKYAIPLNLVHRLEEFKRTDIEYSGAQRLLRYRNAVLPILSLNEFLGFAAEKKESTSETISIIVSRKSSKTYGIEVDEILDVLKTTDSLDDGLSDRPGILGNLVTSEEVIVVVDALQILDTFAGRLKPNSTTAVRDIKSYSFQKGMKVLLVEDTVFFKKHISTILERAGFKVTHAENGADALKLLERMPPDAFDLILSDIEMPKMNGLDMAASIRKDTKWKAVPMIAVTTRFNTEAVQEGKLAGFDSYLEKLNADALLGEIDDLFTKRRAA